MNNYRIIFQHNGKLKQIETALFDDFPEDELKAALERIYGSPVKIVSVKEML